MGNAEQFEKTEVWRDVVDGSIVYQKTETFDQIPYEIRQKIDFSQRGRSGYRPAPQSDDEIGDIIAPSKSIQSGIKKRDYMVLEFGPFFWVRFQKYSLFMKDCNPALLARAFYVGVHNSKWDVFDYRKIGVKGRPSKVMDALQETGLFDGHPDPESFKQHVMWRGKIGDVSNGRCGKLFANQYKSAVESTPPKRHVYIGRIIQLIPFVNLYTNVLCPGDQIGIKNHEEYLRKTDIATLFGVSKTHSYELVDKLCEISFTRNGKKEPVVYQATYGAKKVLCINPHFYYAADILKGDHIFVPKMH